MAPPESPGQASITKRTAGRHRLFSCFDWLDHSFLGDVEARHSAAYRSRLPRQAPVASQLEVSSPEFPCTISAKKTEQTLHRFSYKEESADLGHFRNEEKLSGSRTEAVALATGLAIVHFTFLLGTRARRWNTSAGAGFRVPASY